MSSLHVTARELSTDFGGVRDGGISETHCLRDSLVRAKRGHRIYSRRAPGWRKRGECTDDEQDDRHQRSSSSSAFADCWRTDLGWKHDEDGPHYTFDQRRHRWFAKPIGVVFRFEPTLLEREL